MSVRLTVAQIKALPNGRHRIERGFFLRIHDNRRNWIFQYSYHGKQYQLGLGSALTVPLSTAKELKNQAQAILLSGHNPIDVRREYRSLAKAQSQETHEITFREFWLDVFPRITAVKDWKNRKHRQQWENTIETYALPVIGDKAVRDLSRDDILAVLEPIWKTKTETATRVRSRLEIILGYAIAEGLITGGNPATWKSNLDLFLPSASSVKDVRHHRTVTHEQLKAKINCFNPRYVSHALTLFTILTASRIGETAPALWREIDFENKIWTVPPERRKDKRKESHRVPLSAQSVRLLENLPRCSEYVFPSNYEGSTHTHINTQSPRMLLRKIFGEPITMHGMRSTFRDWCAETGVNDTVAEKCLMHKTGTAVVLAYQRSDLLEQRRAVMQAWADYLYSRFNGSIVQR